MLTLVSGLGTLIYLSSILFAEGAAFSLGGGQVPRSDKEDSTSYMVEAQYKFPVTKNILITPGAYAISMLTTVITTPFLLVFSGQLSVSKLS
jgi:hypothetical protein